MSNTDTFLEEMTEILELEGGLGVEHEFGEEWDSLAIVSTIALVDEIYGVFLEGKDLAKCKSVQSILDLVVSQTT